MWDRIAGDWKSFRHRARREWAHLTNEHLDEIDGRRDRLQRRVGELYGLGDDEAGRQVDTWARGLPRTADGELLHDDVEVFDNAGPELGEHDRPGGAGMPSNQAGGREMPSQGAQR